ncbi:MAG TPA: efflux transporter outer membrane subunit [Candidatus Acidoferrales bacterium]|nr:efflux transporter outer membrane subunit [Candidatus Acidoferrales bacterium]
MKKLSLIASLTILAALSGCDLAPKYQKAAVPTPAAYKEIDGWKVAQPQDSASHGNWWEIFSDQQLNALEDQVNTNNQTIAIAAANFLAARAVVKQARAQFYPTISSSPVINYSRQPFFGAGGSGVTTGGGTGSGGTGGNTTVFASGTFAIYELPFDASWQPDFWGKVRNNIRANVYAAQASAADLENVRLTAQAELAVDYFQLRVQDAQKKLLDDTVKAFQDSYDIAKERFQAGLDSDEDVAQAETQLETAQAQDTDLGILRAQFEHAIALLLGKSASEYSMPQQPLDAHPPLIPVSVPSELLERRPDIAEAERTVAQANSQIGVARAAYYPNITLSASAGLESTSISSWFTWPSRFFSVGPSASETIFDFGSRKGAVEQARANYDRTVANYRQTVLIAFQQVEDNLAALRILNDEVQQQDTAVRSSDRNLKLANDRYRAGIDPYLNVITAQTTLLTNQRVALTLREEQMTRSVQLIEALGGRWNTSQLPSPAQIQGKQSSSSTNPTQHR